MRTQDKKHLIKLNDKNLQGGSIRLVRTTIGRLLAFGVPCLDSSFQERGETGASAKQENGEGGADIELHSSKDNISNSYTNSLSFFLSLSLP